MRSAPCISGTRRVSMTAGSASCAFAGDPDRSSAPLLSDLVLTAYLARSHELPRELWLKPSKYDYTENSLFESHFQNK